MKRNAVALLVLALLSGGCGNKNNEYTHYLPLRFDGNSIVENNQLKTKAHLDRVEQVLAYYKIDYKRLDDLTIELAVPMDADTMRNMTTKAEDEEWLKTHQIKNGT